MGYTTFFHLENESSATIEADELSAHAGVFTLDFINENQDKVIVMLNRKQLETILFQVDTLHSSLVNDEQELANYYESIVLDQELERAQLGE